MDVDTSLERVLPSQNIKSIINPNLPSLDQMMEIDSSIEHKKNVFVYPEPSDIQNRGPIEFVIHDSPGYYLDISSILVDVKLQLLGAARNRDNLAQWRAYFLNNLSQTLWSTIKVSLNGTNIESNYYNQQLSNLNHILTTPNIIVKERGRVQGAFEIDTNTLIETLGAEHIALRPIVDRIAFSKADEIHLTAALQLDLSTATKFLPDGVTMKIILEPSPPQFLIKRTDLVGNTRVNHTFSINSARLQVTKVKPSDGVLISEAKRLGTRPFEYLIRRKVVVDTVFQAGASEFSITRPFQAVIPNKLYIFMVKQAGARGAYHRHPFFYGNNNLQSYSVKLDGLEISGHEMGEGLVQTYVESLRAHGEDYFIPYSLYKHSCFVICIDTNQGSDLNTLAVERRGNLQISLRTRGNIAETLLVYVAGVLDSTFTIDHNKTVTTQYQY